MRRVAVTAGAGAMLLVGTHLWAQTPRQGSAPGFLGTPGPSSDEAAARLFSSPKGEVFRVWNREGDPRVGGGAVLLAGARPKDVWETLLEIRSPEKGVSIRDGDLAVGPANELALAYRWWRNDPRSKQIRVARSDDGGKTWTQSPTPLDGAGKAFDPNIAWGRGKGLVLVWSDERRGNRVFDIYSRRSPDGGVSWEPEQLLSRFPRNLPNDLHARPVLLSDGQDRLWTVWVGLRTGQSALYVNRSVDGGRSWTDPVALSGDSRSVFGQKLVRAGDRLLLVWQDKLTTERDRIYAASSNDAGVTWSLPVRVDPMAADSQSDNGSPTAVLSTDGEAIVAWHDGRNGRADIFLARSTDGGRSWAKENVRMDMDEPGTAVSRFPKLAKAPDGRVAITWEDDRSGYEAVYLRVRSAGQKPEWGPEILVAASSGKVAARIPDLIWGADGIHVTWAVWDHTLAPARVTKQVGGRTLHLENK
jgi:BNR repeat protein